MQSYQYTGSQAAIFAPYHYASTNSHLVMDLGGPVIIVGFSDACHYILGIRMHIMSHVIA